MVFMERFLFTAPSAVLRLALFVIVTSALSACGGTHAADALFGETGGAAGNDASTTGGSAGTGGTGGHDGGPDGSHLGRCETCPVGQVCDMLLGCVPGIACSGTAQCIQKLGDEPWQT